MSKLEDLANQAIAKWGYHNQTRQAAEELAELIVAINHFHRGRILYPDLLEEVADVYIVLQQLRNLVDRNGEFDSILNKKLERLKRKING